MLARSNWAPPMEDCSSYLSWLTLAFLFLLLLLLIFQLTQSSWKTSSAKLPPGPSRLSVICSLLQSIGILSHRPLQELSQQFGDLLYLQLGRMSTVVVSSAELAEEVVKTHDLDFCTRPHRVAFRKLSYNSLDVAFSPYGDTWRQMRKICVIELLSNKRVQLSRGIREEEVAGMVKEIARASSANHMASVDLSGMLTVLNQNITCRTVLGGSWSSQDRHKLLGPLEEAQKVLACTFMTDYFPWAWWVDVVRGWHQRLEKSFSGLDDYYDEVIADHLHHLRAKASDQEDFVDVLLSLQESFDLTRDHIKALMMNIFIAGIDTNTATALWAMCELLRNRRVMNKAIEEVRRTVGSKGKVEDKDLKDLPYLHAMVKEALRLHPPGPLLIPRETIQKCIINGYEIPPKTQVLVNVFSIGRDPRYWKNPLEFLPERFLDHSIGFMGQNLEFLPFGAGRRGCPGIQLGMAIVELTLANLLYSFDWDLPMDMKEEGINMTEWNGITMRKKTPLIVVAQHVN